MKFRVFSQKLLLLVAGTIACSQPQERHDSNAEGGLAGQDEPSGGTGGDAADGGASGGGGAIDSSSIAGRGGDTLDPTTGGNAGSSAGGNAGSMGTGGVGGANVGGAPTAPATSCGDLAICDTFESFATGPYGGGQLQIDGGQRSHYNINTEQKHSGEKSIKVDAGGTGGANRFLKTLLGSKLGDGKSVFSRVWMYFPKLPKLSRSGGSPHYRLVRSFETVPPNVGVNLSAGIVGTDRGRLLYFRPLGFKDCAADGAVLPANKWTCVELRSDASGSDAWIDGRSMGTRSAVQGDACWQAHDKVLSVSFGFEIAAGDLDEPFSFYMDDIAVDDKRIGCQ